MRRQRALTRSCRPLAPRRSRLRDPVAGARCDQQDRVQLRPQHGPELGRGSRLDAVHAGHLAALGHRRRRRRDRRPVGSRGRRLLRRALSRRDRRQHRHLSRDLRLQPRRSGTSTRCSQLAAVFGGGDVDVVFTLDRMAIALEEAQAAVASLAEQLDAAESAAAEPVARAERSTTAAADRPAALRPARRREGAFQADQELAAADAEVERLRTELAQAEAALERPGAGAHVGVVRTRCRGHPADADAERTVTCSRSAAARRRLRRPLTITTIPPRTSPRRRARRSSRSRTAIVALGRRRRPLRHRLRPPHPGRARVGLLPLSLPRPGPPGGRWS